jgi:hypothetical protein
MKIGGRTSTTWARKWKTPGKTIAIRVPGALAPEILRFARALDEQGETSVATPSLPPEAKEKPPLAHLSPKERAKYRREEKKRQAAEEAKAKEEEERRDVFFQAAKRRWQIAELELTRPPFPVEIAEEVYQRFLEGDIPGMERVGKGKHLLACYVDSWATGSAFDAILTIYAQRDRGT